MKISIYKITCSCCDKVYIGSTTMTLEERFNRHLNKINIEFNKFHQHMREQGSDKFKIELIDTILVNNEEERLKLEQKFIDVFDSVKYGFNTNRAFLSKEIKRELNKVYREENKEHIKIVSKEYYEKNKEEISDRDYSKPKAYICELCEFKCKTITALNVHCKSKSHIRKINGEVFYHGDKRRRHELPKNFSCEPCDYKTGRKDTFDRHLKGGRHKKQIKFSLRL